MIYSVMLSAYGLSRKDLEDQVSVTNSIFGTDLSVNTDEEYIIHCDDLSKKLTLIISTRGLADCETLQH